MHDEVVAAVQRYVDGVRSGDPGLVKDAFRSDAVMWGYLGEQFVTMSGTAFAEQVVAGSPAQDGRYVAEIHSVRVAGGVATAILDEHAYLGADFRNHLGLIQADGAWRIASKIFSTTEHLSTTENGD
ncbi:MAG: hypothetical protein BGO95_07110 [Micrococcales bacterium 73-13]|nr:MAG: hypothetical protein BGO95_07110 [Micrococcales bacterium 73-13]